MNVRERSANDKSGHLIIFDDIIGIKLCPWILLFLCPDGRRTSEYVMLRILLLADGLTSWIRIPSCVSAGARRT